MYNIKNVLPIDQNYQNGLLPQRNSAGTFYQESSCRSSLAKFSLSSENRRILRKTDNFTFEISSIFFNLDIQKRIFGWLKELEWDFPISSVKQVFTKHIFNYLYVWKLNDRVVAYSVCYFSPTISHIAYVFYDPVYSHGDLPIRLVLQFIIDSRQKGLTYAYLGRFSKDSGYYKRTMPGFEYFKDNQWQKL